MDVTTEVGDATGEIVELKEEKTTKSRGMTRDTALELMKERARALSTAIISNTDNNTAVLDKIQHLVPLIAKEIAVELPRLTIIPNHPPESQDIVHSTGSTNKLVSDPNKKWRQHRWIECMKEFKSLLFAAETSLRLNKNPDSIVPTIRPIVVALIDDGADVRVLSSKHKRNTDQINGKSFFFSPLDPDRPTPFYKSSGGHGTVMSAQIRRICPHAQLHVLKLQDYTNLETGKRRITLGSAAKVSPLLFPIDWILLTNLI